jgi:hypothetical protein
MAIEPQERKRGGCLTAFLILMLIANPLAGLLYLLAGSTLAHFLPNVPQWAILTFGVLAFANLIFALGIWSWKKWGVYGFVGSSLVAFTINALTLGTISALFGLIGVTILAFLVRPVWTAMEGNRFDSWVLASRTRTTLVIIAFVGLLAVAGVGGSFVLSNSSNYAAAAPRAGTTLAPSALSPSGKQPTAAASEVNRHYEVGGGFSFVPPQGWHLEASPDSRVKSPLAVGPKVGGRTPSIVVVEEVFGGSLDDYVKANLVNLGFTPGFQVLAQNDFQPNEGDRAIKLETMDATYDGRFSFYFFAGPRSKFVITCTRPSTLLATVDLACDQSMRTFRFDLN